MSDANAIEVQGLHKQFGTFQALKGIHLEIARGQIYGLLGPNGAGKTTLIRLLTGSTRPTAGSVRVLGLDPIRDKQAVRLQIGYMPQSPALYDDLSARENIRFFGRARRNRQIASRIDQVIAFVGLQERQNDAVYKFSGGMKQRVSLACAMVNQPRILLLDEPTSGIDPKLRAAFWDHFRDLAASGVTVIVSTHQMDEALYCDRLAILNQGVLLADDSPRILLRENKATVKISLGDQIEEQIVPNLPEQLPKILQRYGLDSAVERIEIQEQSFERVVLQKISDMEQMAEDKADAGGA